MPGNRRITIPRVFILILICATSSLQFVENWMHTPYWIVTKVLTMLLIATLLIGIKPQTRGYRVLVLAGLGCAMVGDIFFGTPSQWITAPGPWFYWTVAFFLLTAVFYTVAFSLGIPWRARDLVAAIPFVANGAVMFWAVQPEVVAVRGPVAVSVVIVSLMGWRATVCAYRRCDVSGLFAGAGAALFNIATAFLGWYMFRQTFEWSLVGVVVSIDAGHLLVALSVLLDTQAGTQRAQKCVQMQIRPRPGSAD